MKQNLGLEKVSMIKKMDFNIEEEFKMTTIGADIYSGNSSYTLLPNFIGNSESYARSWLSSHGISVTTTIKEVEAGAGYYDGQVIDQSFPANKRLDLISGSLNLTVAKVKEKEESTITPQEKATTEEPKEPTTEPTEPTTEPTEPTEPKEPEPKEPNPENPTPEDKQTP